MNCVRVSGPIGLITLWISVISYFVSLILYIISFCLTNWILFTTVPIKIGIWRLCDIEILGYDRCADWSARTYSSNMTNIAFEGPPDYIRTSQSLEIVAVVFYSIAGMLLVLGLCHRSMGLLFFASSMSMFITVVFTSATIGLFAAQGRTLYPGNLSFGWWLAIVALILSIISAFSLVTLSFYIAPVLPPMPDTKMLESNPKMFYTAPPYSANNNNNTNNMYGGQEMNNDYMH